MDFFETVTAVSIVGGICVALPILIVWIIARAATNAQTQRSRVLIEAIKSGNADTAKIVKSIEQNRRTSREILNLRLLRACIFGLVGAVAFAAGVAYACASPETEIHNQLFLVAGVCIPVGASYFIVYMVSRKNLPSEEKRDREDDPETESEN